MPLQFGAAFFVVKYRIRLGVDHNIVIALWRAAAKELIAFVRLACVAVRVFNFTGDDLVLAGGAIAHATAEIEVEVVLFRKFEDAFIVASPLELDAGTFKYDFTHER